MWGLIVCLGGQFGPEKKYLAPPSQKIPQFAADTLPAPRPLLYWRPPRPGIFNKEGSPRPPPGASDSPFPSRSRKKISATSTKMSLCVCVCVCVCLLLLLGCLMPGGVGVNLGGFASELPEVFTLNWFVWSGERVLPPSYWETDVQNASVQKGGRREILENTKDFSHCNRQQEKKQGNQDTKEKG